MFWALRRNFSGIFYSSLKWQLMKMKLCFDCRRRSASLRWGEVGDASLNIPFLTTKALIEYSLQSAAHVLCRFAQYFKVISHHYRHIHTHAYCTFIHTYIHTYIHTNIYIGKTYSGYVMTHYFTRNMLLNEYVQCHHQLTTGRRNSGTLLSQTEEGTQSWSAPLTLALIWRGCGWGLRRVRANRVSQLAVFSWDESCHNCSSVPSINTWAAHVNAVSDMLTIMFPPSAPSPCYMCWNFQISSSAREEGPLGEITLS